MQIFVHTPNGLVLQDIDDHTSVKDLVNQVGLSDASAWLEDADEPLMGFDHSVRVERAEWFRAAGRSALSSAGCRALGLDRAPAGW